MKTVIKNISELIQTEQTARKWVSGKEMSEISTIKNALLNIEDGIITSFGSMNDWNTTTTPMEQDENGIWGIVLPLNSVTISSPRYRSLCLFDLVRSVVSLSQIEKQYRS